MNFNLEFEQVGPGRYESINKTGLGNSHYPAAVVIELIDDSWAWAVLHADEMVDGEIPNYVADSGDSPILDWAKREAFASVQAMGRAQA